MLRLSVTFICVSLGYCTSAVGFAAIHSHFTWRYLSFLRGVLRPYSHPCHHFHRRSQRKFQFATSMNHGPDLLIKCPVPLPFSSFVLVFIFSSTFSPPARTLFAFLWVFFFYVFQPVISDTALTVGCQLKSFLNKVSEGRLRSLGQCYIMFSYYINILLNILKYFFI